MYWASDLRALLDRGLHTDNLRQIADTARRAAFDPSYNLPGFVIEQIARSLCTFWDCPPDLDKHKSAESKLLAPLIEVMDCVIHRGSDEEICKALSRTISAYHVVVSGS